MNRAFLLVSLSLMAVTVGAIAAQSADDERVKIELYYESQCPGCRATITDSFKKAYAAKGFLKMAHVTLIPFGNAKESGDEPPYSFQCQHGETECKYNLIETCALNAIGCPYQQFQFINCIESHDESREPSQDYDAVLGTCSILVGVSKDHEDEITACYKSDEGNKLEHDMATKTAALTPPHEYVPWIVADGVHNDDVQDQVMDSLLEYVCGTYSGPDKSPDCPETTTVVEARGVKGGVCHRDAPFAIDLQ